MNLNYFRLGLRNLRFNKSYTILNIVGFSVGIFCCISIMLFIQDELKYDKYHENYDRIWRITTDGYCDGGEPTNINGPYVSGPEMCRLIPEIENFVRFSKRGQASTNVLVKRDNEFFYESRFFFTDSTVFDVFTYEFLEGDPKTALSKPNTVVIPEATAIRYFSNTDVIGKTISVDLSNKGIYTDFEITGIIKNPPKQSHFTFDFLASIVNDPMLRDRWAGFFQVFNYVLLSPNANPESIIPRMLEIQKEHWDGGGELWYHFSMQPLKDIHLRSNYSCEIETNGNIVHIWTFLTIAIFVLILACVNFINLSTAQAAKRSKEIGLRKVMGANRKQLISQFLIESLFLSFAALILALLSLEFILPKINSFTGKELSFWINGNIQIQLATFILTAIAGLIAGIYPAFYLSSFAPTVSLKGEKIVGPKGAFLRKGLVVFQFFVTVLLLASTIITYNQMKFMRHTNIGYDRDQLLLLPMNASLTPKIETFKNELVKDSNIINVATSRQVPTKGSYHSSFDVLELEQDLMPAYYEVSHDFLKTYGIETIVSDNTEIDFDKNYSTVIINETAAKSLGLDYNDVLGKTVELWEGKRSISAIVKDFHIHSLHEDVYQCMIIPEPAKRHNYITIRLRKNNIEKALNSVHNTWDDFLPTIPFQYSFMDDEFARLHKSDMKLESLLKVFTGLAFLVACLGILGLTAYTVERRGKEIAVRKVLGASITNILNLIGKEFALLVIIASLVALPASWFIMTQWLNNFAYKAPLSIWLFPVSGLLALFIAMSTVIILALKAALKNPTDVFRSE